MKRAPFFLIALLFSCTSAVHAGTRHEETLKALVLLGEASGKLLALGICNTPSDILSKQCELGTIASNILDLHCHSYIHSEKCLELYRKSCILMQELHLEEATKAPISIEINAKTDITTPASETIAQQ